VFQIEISKEMPSVSQSRVNTRADEVARKLKGIERYNPNCRPMLEEYVQYQIENRFYDFDANMALLKMYQFDPSNFQADKVADILLLALTNLPKPDFLLCKYLLDTQKVYFENKNSSVENDFLVSRKCTYC